MTNRLFHTGRVIVDQVMEVPHLPERGGDVLAALAYRTAGGGLNSMVAAARDGMDVLYCGLVGTGPNGALVDAALAEHGIAALLPRVTDRDNGYCVVLVEPSGERTFATHVGVEGELGADHLAALALRDGDTVYVSGYSLTTSITAAALRNWLPEVPGSVRVVVDPAPVIGDLPPRAVRALLDRADVWTANAREASILTGLPQPRDAAAALSARLRPSAHALVRDGARPTIVAAKGDVLGEVAAFPTTPVDTNGAGDAHTGVLMAALARGEDLRTATRRANAAASLAVRRSGPTSAPSAAEIDALLAAAG